LRNDILSNGPLLPFGENGRYLGAHWVGNSIELIIDCVLYIIISFTL